MENATKALLIAAAVLIVIVLVALGIKLLGSTSDTQEVATGVGQSIGDKTGQVSVSVVDNIKLNLSDKMDNESFNEYIKNKFSGEKTGEEVLKLCTLLKSQYGSLHEEDGGHTRTHISCAYGLKYYEIEEKTVKENKYNVKFSESTGGYSIEVHQK